MERRISTVPGSVSFNHHRSLMKRAPMATTPRRSGLKLFSVIFPIACFVLSLMGSGYAVADAPTEESTESKARNFIEQYWQAWSAPNSTALPAMSAMYAPQVNFYGKATSHDELMKEKAKFAGRWPNRRYTDNSNSEVVSCLPTDVCHISGVVNWTAHSDSRNATSSGVSRYELQIAFSSSGARIIFESGANLPGNVPSAVPTPFPDTSVASPIHHVDLATDMLEQARQRFAEARANALQAYNAANLLRLNARNVLGCGNAADGQCLGETAGAVMSANNPTASSAWRVLWITEGLRGMSEPPADYRTGDIPGALGKIAAFRRTLDHASQATGSDLTNAARDASMTVALLAEVNGKVLRKMANDLEEGMGEFQIGFHGALVAVTEPGRRMTQSIVIAVESTEKAEREIDLATEAISLPPGNVLIHTPTHRSGSDSVSPQ
jgi:hypothetical protein